MKGINLISTLIEEYGEEVVNFYMENIQKNAEMSVRSLLREVSKRFEGQDLRAVDYMDDGSPIKLKITNIDAERGRRCLISRERDRKFMVCFPSFLSLLFYPFQKRLLANILVFV